MELLLKCSLASVLILALSPLQNGQTPPSKPSLKLFSDPSLGISYRFPSYLETQETVSGMTAMRNQQSDPGTRARMGCMSLPLEAHHKTATDHDSLEIFEFDFACMRKYVDVASMDSVIVGAMGNSLRVYGGEPKTGIPQHYELSGYQATFLEASVDAPSIKTGMVLFSGSACLLMKQTVVCWAMMSADKAKLHQFLRNPVTIAASAAVPLVPDQLLMQ